MKREKEDLWGSPAYFSPSMITSSTFTLSDDIWALGVIMYELFCKIHPFKLNGTDDLKKIVEEEVLPFPRELSSTIKQILSHMLNKDLKKRTKLPILIKCCELLQE
mgnify:CR=1 FL=1